MSSIRNRLHNLQGNNTAATGLVTADSAGLRQRIQRIAQRARLINGPRVRNKALDQFLGGQWLSEYCLLIERRLPLGRLHGDVQLKDIQSVDLSLFAEDLPPAAIERLVFMDTETSGLSGGSGTLVFLLGLGRVEAGEFILRQYLLTGYAGESTLYQHAAAWLDEDSILVSFNGKSFDLPLLETRQRLLRLVPTAIKTHIDLLHHTRRAYALRWRDCSLKSTERKLLAFNRHDDLPSAEAPRVWQEFVRFGNSSRLSALLQHHYWDVLSLLALLVRLHAVFNDPQRHNANAHAIARYYVKGKRGDLALEKLQGSQAVLDVAGKLELARLYRARGQWPKAIAIWQELADTQGCQTSLENLAKYHEHVAKDYDRAMEFTKRMQLQHSPSIGVQQRMQRLSRKNVSSWNDLKLLLSASA